MSRRTTNVTRESTGVDRQLYVDEEFERKILDYNDNLCNIDPLYGDLKFFNYNILVRVKLQPLQKTGDGMLLPNTQLLPVPTKSGYGSLEHIESPYPYTKEAVIVNYGGMHNENSGEVVTHSLPAELRKQGARVMLAANPIKVMAIGTGKDVTLNVPNAFFRQDYYDDVNISDPSNKHYGYLLIAVNDIVCVLPD